MGTNTLQKITPPAEAETELQLRTEAGEILAEAKSMKVTTVAELSTATDTVKLIKTIQREAEADRVTMTGPLNAVLKNINDRYKRISVPLKEADDILRRKMSVFQSEQARLERIRQDEERKKAAEKAREEAEAQAAKGNEQAAEELEQHADRIEAAPIEVAKSIVSGAATGAKSVLTKRWTFRVKSIAVLSAEHPELVTVDSAAIRKRIAEGAREIPGLEIYQEESVSVR